MIDKCERIKKLVARGIVKRYSASGVAYIGGCDWPPVPVLSLPVDTPIEIFALVEPDEESSND